MKRTSPMVEKRVERRHTARRILLVIVGATVLAIGWLGVLLSSEPLGSYDNEYGFLMAFVGSLGGAVVTYAVIGFRVPMWMVRDGHEPDNRKAVALQVIGIFLIITALLSAQVAWQRDNLNEDGLGQVMIVAMLGVLIAVLGATRKPLFLFREDERVTVPFKERAVVGAASSMTGLLVMVLVTFFAPHLVYVNFLGLVVVITGFLTVAVGSYRPWLSTGYEK